MRDQSKEKKRRKALYEEYGNLTQVEAKDIPEEHKAPFGGGLRCFGKICVRDKVTGVKLKDKKRRCKNPAIKGSLFCKKCGGNNVNSLVTGRFSAMSVYRKHYPTKFGDVLEAFMTDPNVIDLKPELAHLRVILMNYVNMLSKARPKSPRKIMRLIKKISASEDANDFEKYLAIREIIEEQVAITDGKSIDRINRTVDTVGKTVERIHRIQSREEFMFTPDGIRILLRAIVELIQKHVPDVGAQKIMRDEFMQLSTITSGDVSKLEPTIAGAALEIKDEIRKTAIELRSDNGTWEKEE